MLSFLLFCFKFLIEFLVLGRVIILVLFVFTIHYATLHQLVSKSSLLSMPQRRRGRGNHFAKLGEVLERKEAMYEEQLAMPLQRMGASWADG